MAHIFNTQVIDPNDPRLQELIPTPSFFGVPIQAGQIPVASQNVQIATPGIQPEGLITGIEQPVVAQPTIEQIQPQAQPIQQPAATGAQPDGGFDLGGLLGGIGGAIGGAVGGVSEALGGLDLDPALTTGLITAGIGALSGQTALRSLSAGGVAGATVAERLNAQKAIQDKLAAQQRIAQSKVQRDLIKEKKDLNVQINRDTKDLRKEFNNDPVIKATKEMNTSVARMDAVFQDFLDDPEKLASKNALDQALIITFNKMLDPGSVVRESEFARTPQNQALVAQFFGRIQAIKGGGVGLTDPERKELVRTAKLLLEGQQNIANQTREDFVTEAKELGVDPKRVLGRRNLDKLVKKSKKPVVKKIPKGDRKAALDFIKNNPNDPSVPAIRKALGL